MSVQSYLQIEKNKKTVQAGYTVATNLGFPKGRLTERFLALKYFYTDKPGAGRITPKDIDINYDMFEGVLNPFYNGLLIGVPAERKVSSNPILEAYHIGTNGIQSLVKLNKATLDQTNNYEGVLNKEETTKTWDIEGVRNHLVADYPTNVGNEKEVNEFIFVQDGPLNFFSYGPVVRTVETLFIDTFENMPSPSSSYYANYYPIMALNESKGEVIYYSNRGQWIYIKNGKKMIMQFEGFDPKVIYDNVTVIDNQFVFDRVGNSYDILELNIVTDIIDNGDGTCNCYTTQKNIKLPRKFSSPSRTDKNYLLLFEWGDEIYVLQVIEYIRDSAKKNPLAIYRIKKDLSEILYEYVPEFTWRGVDLLYKHPFYDPAFPGQVLIANHRLEKNTLKFTPDFVQNALKVEKSIGCYRRLPNMDRAFGYSYLGNNICAFGYVEVEDPIVSFKLDSPIIKTPDEVMKLTFDINIFNEDYYSE